MEIFSTLLSKNIQLNDSKIIGNARMLKSKVPQKLSESNLMKKPFKALQINF